MAQQFVLGFRVKQTVFISTENRGGTNAMYSCVGCAPYNVKDHHLHPHPGVVQHLTCMAESMGLAGKGCRV